MTTKCSNIFELLKCTYVNEYLQNGGSNNSANALHQDVQNRPYQIDFPGNEEADSDRWIDVSSTYMSNCLKWSIIFFKY